MGLYPMHEEPGQVFYKAWDEYDHHSLVLEEGGVGLVKLGYKVSDPADIEVYEKRAQQFGCLVERMSAGDNLEVSDGIRIVLPSDHVVELYHGMTLVGTEVGTHNPEVFPRHLVGVGAPRIDHALITAEDPGLVDRFFREVLDFYAAERVATSLDDDAQIIGSWLSTSNTPHDIAVIGGPNGKLHHFAFELTDWSEIKRAGGLFAMDDVPVDVGRRNGITRGETIYSFTPQGTATRSSPAATSPSRTGPPSRGRSTSWPRASSTSAASSTSGSPPFSPDPRRRRPARPVGGRPPVVRA